MKDKLLLLIGGILQGLVYLVFAIPATYFCIKWFMFANTYLYNLDLYWLFKLPLYLLAILINISPAFLTGIMLSIQDNIKEKLPMFYKQ